MDDQLRHVTLTLYPLFTHAANPRSMPSGRHDQRQHAIFIHTRVRLVLRRQRCCRYPRTMAARRALNDAQPRRCVSSGASNGSAAQAMLHAAATHAATMHRAACSCSFSLNATNAAAAASMHARGRSAMQSTVGRFLHKTTEPRNDERHFFFFCHQRALR
jgi:hypothetical protein